MLVSTRGDDAEAFAESQLQDAGRRGHEGDTLVWDGVLTQIRKMRVNGGA